MTPAAAFAIIAALFGVAGTLAGAYAVLRSGIATRTIELWKAQAEALEARLKESESEHAACEEELAEVRLRLDGLEQSHELLARIVGAAAGTEAARTIAEMSAPRTRRRPRPAGTEATQTIAEQREPGPRRGKKEHDG